MNLNLLQPGDIAFTTDKYGNLLGGHSTHTFIFMSWANKEKTLMNICDNQARTYGSVLHVRPIYNTSLTDATAFFYHTSIPTVSSILKLPAAASVNSVAYNKVKITWDAAPGAYGYKLYRSSSKYGTYSYIGVTRNTDYTDSSVSTGRTYYYKVRAYNYAGTSIVYGDYSDVLNATPFLSAPAAVVNSNSYGKVKLSWKGVSGASGYQVVRSTSRNGSYTSAASTSHTSYTKSGLTRGRTYYYKVRAYKYVGKSKVYSNYSLINVKVN
jgi:fibronectin type 3 domain-containing protein